MTKLSVLLRGPASCLPPSEQPMVKKTPGSLTFAATKVLLLLGCMLVAKAAAQTSETAVAPTRDQYRLPKNVKPLLYDIRLKPDFYGTNTSAYQFTGYVQIRIVCQASTRNITLHMDGLTISDKDITVRKVCRYTNLFKKSTYEVARNFLTLHLNECLRSGKRYVIEFRHFSRPLRMDLFGFSLHDYQDGEQRVVMAGSTLSMTFARKVFPCFDEPEMKAVFKIALMRRTDVPRRYTCLSNTDLSFTYYESDPDGNQWAVDHFDRTPLMSTYILSFVVSDFKHLAQTTKTKPPIDMRVYVRPNAVQYAKRMLENSVEYFEFLDSTFYPAYGDDFNKLNSVVFPDFIDRAGLENWGSITVGKMLLSSEKLTSAYMKNYQYMLFSHELSHMWFGDYVTITWWDHLWLFQGFATWASMFTLDNLHPTWKAWDEWKSDTYLFKAFNQDARATSHPLVANARTPREIWGLLDDVNYNKGALFLEMLRLIMGDDSFVLALNNYLRKYRFKNADSADFMRELDKVMSTKTGTPDFMSSKMNPWLYQMGFPLVMVNKTTTGFRLSQKRFLIGPADATSDLYKDNPYGYQWNIPLLYATDELPTECFTDKDVVWMDRNKEVEINDNGVSDWLLVNVGYKGFYRVSYDDASWAALIAQLNEDHEIFPATNRGLIISDAFWLYWAGMLDLSEALKTIDYLKSETELPGWRAFRYAMITKLRFLLESKYAPDLKAYIENLVKQPIHTLSFDSHVGMIPKDALVREQLQKFSCLVNSPECIEESVEYLKQWRASSIEEINPDKRYYMGCAGIANGDSSDWQFMYGQLKTASFLVYKDIVYALTCTKDPANIERFLNMALDPAEIIRSEVTTGLSYLTTTVEGRAGILKFLEERFDDMIQGVGAYTMNTVLGYVGKYTVNDANLAKLKSFLGNQNMASIHPGINQAIATAGANQAWVSQNSQALDAWLKVTKT